MQLVIVESPTKAKTIGKFLGAKFRVESSFGHIRDLPEKKIGVDTAGDFTPTYVVPAKAKANLAKLISLVEEADDVILATDEDREGEAIAWHLREALGKKAHDAGRIVFHEITAAAIKEAIAHPRPIDMRLVDAQQARRVVDRLVGYELSPFLWKKVVKGLSAGRVQSVAVRLTVEREREITAFKTDEYWSIEAELSRRDDQPVSEREAAARFRARLFAQNGKTLDKLALKNEAEANAVVTALKEARWVVAAVERKEQKKYPTPPFTTSTLQQAANRRLGYSAKQTMAVAQQLYEQGFITYMRTDSVFMADKFLTEAKEHLKTALGDRYILSVPRRFKTKSKGAQEAHEAIRPTEAARAPETLADTLEPRQLKLYALIWQRALASQMPEALLDATVIDIDPAKTPYRFRATGQVLRFDGFLRLYPDATEDVVLPDVKEKEALECHRVIPEQHFTKPPGRYSDAGLVKVMEKYGIGRPSTYAPTIATIIDRNYVERDEQKKLKPTEIAFVVVDLLVAHFPIIVDFQFTAKMEADLDRVAEGELGWVPLVRDFYEPFHANLAVKYDEVQKSEVVPLAATDEICDKCGKPMMIKLGRNGKFLACTGYPECKNTKPLAADGTGADPVVEALRQEHKDAVCEKCGSPMAVKVGRFGPFLACTGYPKCKNIKGLGGSANKSTGITCPVCKIGEIVEKRSRRGPFYACNKYPDCKTSFSSRPTGAVCPDCGALLVEKKSGAACSNKDCEYKKEG